MVNIGVILESERFLSKSISHVIVSTQFELDTVLVDFVIFDAH